MGFFKENFLENAIPDPCLSDFDLQISSKISFNFMNELKAIEELSQPNSQPAGSSGKMKRLGKRKCCAALSRKDIKRN